MQVRWLKLVCLGLAGVSASCAPGRPADDTVVIVQAGGPESLEPWQNMEGASARVLGNVFESLVELDANLKLQPALAASWYTPDPTTWVFRLRDGARWHDGSEVKPRDVVASLERARSDPRSRRRPELAQVTSIREGGPREVILTTHSPFGAFLGQLAQVDVSRPPSTPGGFPLGTGPYRLASFKPDMETRLAPMDPERGLPALRFVVVREPVTRLEMLRDGSAQISPDLAAREAVAAEESGRITVLRRRGLLITFLAIDTAREVTPYASPRRNPLRDLRVRRALASAVNRDELVAAAVDGQGAPLNQLVVPEAFGYASEAPPPLTDVSLARRLMAEAGFGSGFDLTLDFEGREGEDVMGRIASTLAAQFALINVRLQLRGQTIRQLIARIESRDTSLCLLPWVGTSGDFGSTAEFLLHTPADGRGTSNSGGYSSAEADHLIDEAAATLDPAVRLAVLKRLESRIRADVPVIPLLRQMDVYGVAEGIKFEPRLDREIRGATLVLSRKR